MNFIQLSLLGVIQGLTEFLPISSSGHLVLIPWFFDWEYQGLSLDVALHFGTLLAVVLYFRKDWLNIFQSALTGKKSQYSQNFLWYLVVASIPGALAGFFLNDLAEIALRNPLIVAFTLVFFGFWLFYFDKIGKKKKNEKQISLKEAAWIGIAQAIAIIPGTSRSGITITAGLQMGLDRKSAARFSFLMATPIIFGAAIYKFEDFLNLNTGVVEILAIFFAFISGYIAIAGLIKLVEKVSYKWFFWYRLVLAGLILLFWFYK
ncbi:MAG: undecaprenyl-diphosphate phosphatase [Candidatus Moranbacteria bacterium]|nr:undecaprenyl-diphosphate phosphatase [Candidatus Moranbacteria bacterium]